MKVAKSEATLEVYKTKIDSMDDLKQQLNDLKQMNDHLEKELMKTESVKQELENHKEGI